MSLPNNYHQASGRIPELFEKIRDGQAPDQLSYQTLLDWGFTSSNDRAFIPILKAIGFLSPDGRPTSRYHEYRDHSVSKRIMGEALRDAYKDIFLIKEHPTSQDRDSIQGKFKSFHNTTDRMAGLMTKTFFALLSLAELKSVTPKKIEPSSAKEKSDEKDVDESKFSAAKNVAQGGFASTGLHYNIQIHLPATKDIEVYNAIFKSLKLHLFNE